MSKKNKNDFKEMSRRSFLRRAGATLVTGAVAASVPTSLGLAQSATGDWDAETDVVVLGSGIAGATAAVAAAETGASTLVLERSANPGGSSRRAGGILYLGGGTGPQLANGFEDTPEDMYEYLIRAMGIGVEEERIRAYCNGSVELYDWLVSLGVPFNNKYDDGKVVQTMDDTTLAYSGSERSYPYSEFAKPFPRAHKVAAEGSSGYVLMDVLHDNAVELGVEFEFNTRAQNLIVDDGNVIGVEAHNTSTGETIRVRARRAVIVATGGFQFNTELVALHLPQLLKTSAPLGAPEEDGDGLLMGQRVGAQVHNLAYGSPWKFIYPPDAMVKSILVGPNATRFITEDIYGGNAADLTIRFNEGVAYQIYDEAIRAEAAELGFEYTPIAQGETLQELAENLGLDGAALENTVSFYNEQAVQGRDPLFHKHADFLQPIDSAPYYALDFSGDSGHVWITLGGLRTDETGRVLDVDGEPIGGFYAAGRAAAALGSIYNSGTSLGDGAYFGRMAGMHAARLEDR